MKNVVQCTHKQTQTKTFLHACLMRVETENEKRERLREKQRGLVSRGCDVVREQEDKALCIFCASAGAASAARISSCRLIPSTFTVG